MATAIFGSNMRPPTRLSYKVEELLALRASVSKSAVSLDRFTAEDSVKEHILRHSQSSSGISCAPREIKFKSSTVSNTSSEHKSSNQAATTFVNAKKPSPSSSLKRDKAEKLLKEHGSPPGVRVTAGGRIVPSETTSIPPRPNGWLFTGPQPYMYNSRAIPPLALNYPTTFPYGYPMTLQMPQMLQQPMQANWQGNYSGEQGLYQWPVGLAPTWQPESLDPLAGNLTVKSFEPNNSSTYDHFGRKQSLPSTRVTCFPDMQRVLVPLAPMTDKDGLRDIGEEVKYCWLSHNFVERTRQELEREMVRLGQEPPNHMSLRVRESMVTQKKELIRIADLIRKRALIVEQLQNDGKVKVRPSNFPLEHAIFGGEENAWQSAGLAAAADESVLETNDLPLFTKSEMSGASKKRSRAIPIKAPGSAEITPKAVSTLNPASPAYQPTKLVSARHMSGGMSPSIISSPSPAGNTTPSALPHNSRDSSKESASSASTSDFFPKDTEKHSLIKYTMAGNGQARSSSTESVKGTMSESIMQMVNDALITDLEGKSQQYTLGFLVGLTGKSSNMTKPTDWLQGYCNGLQQRLQSSDQVKPHDLNSSSPNIPIVPATTGVTAFHVATPDYTEHPPRAENVQKMSSFRPPNNSSFRNHTWSPHVPRFPGDGPSARSGSVAPFQVLYQPFVPKLRSTDTVQTLASHAGNRGHAQPQAFGQSFKGKPTTSHKAGIFNRSSDASEFGMDNIVHYSQTQPLLATCVDGHQDVPNRSYMAGSISTRQHAEQKHVKHAKNVNLSVATSGQQSSKNNPTRSSEMSESPKRSPGKRLEQITRHFRLGNPSLDQPTEGSSPMTNESQTGGGRRWRDGLGRRFSRRDREEESHESKATRSFAPGSGGVLEKS